MKAYPVRKLVALGVAVSLAALAFGVSPVSPAQATSAPLCAGYNGQNTANPAAQVMSGYFVANGHPSYKVASGSSVSWDANPYNDVSWQTWLNSLKWVGALINDYQHTGNRVSLDRAIAIAADYIAKKPLGKTNNPALEANSMGHRAQLYACLAEVTGSISFLQAAGAALATYLETHWAGVWNQGLDQDLGILTIGCVMGYPKLTAFATSRLAASSGVVFDDEGATNEQSPGYALYSYDRWQIALDRITRCGQTPPGGMSGRLAKVPTFIAQATGPDGNFVQIGDTEAVPPFDHPGTDITYVATKGVSGVAPVDRVKVYNAAGYVFGRTAWSPFADASYYTLRFGPPKAFHGHFDHTQVTYFAQGRQVIVDSGHIGYSAVADRAWLWSPEAHNVMTADGLRANWTRPTTLVSQTQTADWDAYRLSDEPYDGINRIRNVLISRTPDFIASYDTGTSNVTRKYRVLWHLPSGMSVVVTGRSRATASAGSVQTTILRVAMPGEVLGSGSMLLSPGFVSPRIGVKNADPVMMLPTLARSTGIFSVVVPAPIGTAVSAVSSRDIDGRVLVTITIGAAVHVVKLAKDGSISQVS